MRVGEWVGTLCALCCACAPAVAINKNAARNPGDAYGEPTMEVLPGLDVDEQALTREMRMARMLSAESLNLRDPVPPESRSSQDVEAWSEQTLGPWLRHKHKRAEAARQELDRAAGQSERQRIIAGALVGLVYEDVARVLLQVPSPAELDGEPEIRAMHRELLLEQAAPYLENAKLAYDACAANAKNIETLRHWSAFCDTRSSQLPARSSPELGASETTVSVSRSHD